jgi:hypothetical protein
MLEIICSIFVLLEWESDSMAEQVNGGCHCGAVRFAMPTAVEHHTLCHCTDCRRHAGAPAVAWAMASMDAVAITGSPVVYASSEHGRRHFCGACGTGLFYTNEAIFPGMIDVQSATLDDPDAIPLQAQIQLADRIGWMAGADDLPGFERYPPMG